MGVYGNNLKRQVDCVCGQWLLRCTCTIVNCKYVTVGVGSL